MTPDSLLQSWNLLCGVAGLDGSGEGEKIINCYTKNGLAYHNLTHLQDCLKEFTNRKNEARDPIAVELAIWFHDAIYNPRANDNEAKSAQMAADFLSNTKWEHSVPKLILATKHQDEPSSHDAQLLCDIDLGILSSESSTYRDYAMAIRNEYGWVEEEAYRNGRTAVLKSFLDRPFIFALPASRDLSEKRARQNINRELEDLNKAN
jgi:predicted metal-dependent HD superfamily phosphohydrolase